MWLISVNLSDNNAFSTCCFVSQQDQQHQRAPQVGPKPRPSPPTNPSRGHPSEISSPPQMYNKGGRGDPNPSQGATPPPAPAQAPGQPGPPPVSQNPSLARVQEVMARVLLLQEDVDEFVGKKTDRNYRYLEELLTKELLVLDSVETQGQENVRQARKEAVQRIQAILDQLERKAFWVGLVSECESWSCSPPLQTHLQPHLHPASRSSMDKMRVSSLGAVLLFSTDI